MKRIVITGLGIISSIGNNKKKVIHSLKKGISGISFSKEMQSSGLHSNVWGNILINRFYIDSIPRKILKFMNKASLYSYLAMKSAIKDSKLNVPLYSKNPRVGLIVGSGAGAIQSILQGFNYFNNLKNKIKKISPYVAFKGMNSSISALLGSIFNIYGCNYSVNSACTTSSYCIGNAIELIASGKQDIVFAGGGEELSLALASQFDAMRVLSKNFNNFPTLASRSLDKNRDGFVISGGSGILVLEELNFALSRKATIYAEILDYSATCDGYHPIDPSGNGAVRCMRNVLKNINYKIDYLNIHGTSTQIGDLKELYAIHKVFRVHKEIPYISSTKSITGHSLGSSGVHEIIYTLLMMCENFIAPSLNIESLDPNFFYFPIVTNTIYKKLFVAMSNNFGFGGSNFSIILKKYLI